MRQPLSETHPQLAAELADQSLGGKLSAGRDMKVLWREPCDEGLCRVEPEGCLC